jgi:AraC-like DNA-binding protein
MRANLETLIHPPDSFLVSKKIRLPAFNHPYHFHPEIEVTFIQASSGTRVIGDDIGSFHPGELYLLGANLPHVFRNTVLPERPAEAEVLQFLRDPRSGFWESLPEAQAFLALLDRSQSGLVFDRKTSGSAGALLRQIRERTGARRLAAFFELAGTLLEAPVPRMLASPGSPSPIRQTSGSLRIHRICTVILGRFAESLSHREMARLAHMAPASFSRLFLRTTGKTFTQFVTEVRLGHATRLLCESDATIAGVAFASGFNNLAHFNRQFRRHHNCSPRKYRADFRSAVS